MLIYRLRQLQQIFVSPQQIKQDIASRAMLNTIGIVLPFRLLEMVNH